MNELRDFFRVFSRTLAQVTVARRLGFIDWIGKKIVAKEDSNPYALKPSSPTLSLNDTSITFPRRALLGSLLVMLPWPMLGIAACLGLSLFEKSGEVLFLFGSVTMLFLLPLGLFVSSEWVFSVLVGVVWGVALFLPIFFPKKSIHPQYHVERVLLYQSLFSAIQAGFGFLVILGKQC